MSDVQYDDMNLLFVNPARKDGIRKENKNNFNGATTNHEDMVTNHGLIII